MKRRSILIITVLALTAIIIGVVLVRFQPLQNGGTGSRGTFTRDPDTGEERFGDPNQNPNEQNPSEESPFMSLLGTGVLESASLSPDQIESLRLALRQYAVTNLQATPSEAAILRAANNQLLDPSDESLNFIVKYRPQGVEVTVKAFPTPLGVSIYVGEKGPYFGDTKNTR